MDITIGEIIAQKRKEKHLTQLQLAEKFGITDKAVSKWERNLSKPDEKFMPELVEFLGLPVECLPREPECNPDTMMFFKTMWQESFRVICVGLMIASVISFIAGFISVESTVIMLGSSVTAFAFATILKM